MNLFIKQKQIHRLRKQTYGYHEGTMGARDSQGVLDRYVHTAIFKMNNQQGRAQGTLFNVTWQLDGRGIYGRMETCIYG